MTSAIIASAWILVGGAMVVRPNSDGMALTGMLVLLVATVAGLLA